jgi:hypothetical protein
VWLSRVLIWLPQRQKRDQYRAVRRDLMRADEKLGKMLAYTGRSD